MREWRATIDAVDERTAEAIGLGLFSVESEHTITVPDEFDTEAQSDVRTILILAAVAALAGAGEGIPDAVQKLQGQLVKDDA
jgi:hypothetical protein